LARILVAGCGFLGEAAADFFAAKGWSVIGLTGSEESAARLAGKPYSVFAADLTSASSVAALRNRIGPCAAVLHCASSGRGGADAYRAIYVDGCTNLVANFPEARLIFTSSTSVYAQTDGDWVDEDSPAEPFRETGRLLLEAEAVTRHASGAILRLAGIYGPGRSVLRRKFLDGTAVLENGGTRWINQIHRDDAVAAVDAIMSAKDPIGLCNVVDGRPATQREVYGWLAEHFDRPLPPEGPADLHRKRGWTSKRVSNARLRALGWTPAFPSYREALPTLP
jgi:nucleoside-diphosphate-sugar epimerase